MYRFQTGWSNVKIVPKEREDWKIRTTLEQPSGFVESVLVKDNMQLGDRGNYYCRDTKNIASFSIWVTTLQGRSLFFIDDYEIISERKCKIRVPLLFLELIICFKRNLQQIHSANIYFLLK